MQVYMHYTKMMKLPVTSKLYQKVSVSRSKCSSVDIRITALQSIYHFTRGSSATLPFSSLRDQVDRRERAIVTSIVRIHVDGKRAFFFFLFLQEKKRKDQTARTTEV